MLKRKRLTRRDFLKFLKVGAIDLALLALGGFGYSVLVGPAQFTIETVPLKLPGIPHAFSDLSMAQSSDIHNKTSKGNLNDLMTMITGSY